MRQKYQAGQEDQLGALGLVVNTIVLWNTLHMNKVIEHLKATGEAPQEKYVKRLNPLGFKHIRFLGQFAFSLRARPDAVGLRPLRQAQAL